MCKEKRSVYFKLNVNKHTFDSTKMALNDIIKWQKLKSMNILL